MEIKLIATDIDGTLLNDKHDISLETKELLAYFIENGGKFVLASGRAYESTKKILEKLGLEGIVITYNGARIVDTRNNEILYHELLEAVYVKKLIEIARKYSIHVNIYKNDDWYVENKTREESIYYAKACGKDPIEINFNDFEDFSATKVLFIAENNMLKKIEDEIRKELKSEVHITYSKSTFLEVLNKKVNKGEALKKILELLNIEKENCIAFGDELNDKEMLEYVKYGIVMENGNSILKDRIPHKTLSNKENGIYHFLKEVLENKEDTYLDILIKKTRTHRSFYQEKIPREDIMKIINSTRYSGTARNSQEIRYVIINSTEISKKIFQYTKWASSILWNPDIKEDSPETYILLCTKKEISLPENFIYFDMGLATQNMLLKAKELGYDGCVLGSFNRVEIDKIIELDKEYKSYMLLALGKGKEKVRIVPSNEDVSYYRLGNEHFVRKLPLNKFIIKEM